MSTSSLARRTVPALAALTVLLLVVGIVAALRSTGDGAADASGSNGTAGDPPALALTDSALPPPVAPVEQRFRLAGDLPAAVPDVVAVQRLGAPSGPAGRDLAAALGLPTSGASAAGATTWHSGQRTLRVQDAPGGQWQYDIGRSTICQTGPSRSPATGDTTGPAATSCVLPPNPQPEDSGVSPTETADPATGTAVLRATGVRAGDVVERRTSPTVATLLGEPTVAGLPTAGLTSAVHLVGEQAVDAGGWLPQTTAGPDYPVVSARTAWDRLRRTPLPQTLVACTEPIPPGSDPLTCGGPVTITGARLGLSLQHVGDRPVLVPSWLFRVRDSDRELPVVALPERLLRAATGSGGSNGSSGRATGAVPTTGTMTAVPPTPGRGPGTDPVTPEPAPGTRFSDVRATGDRQLSVSFTGGVAACHTYRVVADETAGAVRLSLKQTAAPDKVCVDLAQVYRRTVPLDAPLGARRVVDAVSGQVLLTGSR